MVASACGTISADLIAIARYRAEGAAELLKRRRDRPEEEHVARIARRASAPPARLPRFPAIQSLGHRDLLAALRHRSTRSAIDHEDHDELSLVPCSAVIEEPEPLLRPGRIDPRPPRPAPRVLRPPRCRSPGRTRQPRALRRELARLPRARARRQRLAPHHARPARAHRSNASSALRPRRGALELRNSTTMQDGADACEGDPLLDAALPASAQRKGPGRVISIPASRYETPTTHRELAGELACASPAALHVGCPHRLSPNHSKRLTQRHPAPPSEHPYRLLRTSPILTASVDPTPSSARRICGLDVDNRPPRANSLVREKLISLQQLRQARKTSRSKTGQEPRATRSRKLGYHHRRGDHELPRHSSTAVPAINLDEYEIDAEVLKLVSRDVCEKHRVIPVSRVGRGAHRGDGRSDEPPRDRRHQVPHAAYNVEPVVASETAHHGAPSSATTTPAPPTTRCMSRASATRRSSFAGDERRPERPRAREAPARTRPSSAS